MIEKIIRYWKIGKVPLSPAVRAGGYIFISGQVPVDENNQLVKGGIEVQAEIVFKKIEALLKQAGSSIEDVVKTTVFLTDINDFGAMNKVYQKFFLKNPPARSCFEVKLAIDATIEVEAIAYYPKTIPIHDGTVKNNMKECE